MPSYTVSMRIRAVAKITVQAASAEEAGEFAAELLQQDRLELGGPGRGEAFDAEFFAVDFDTDEVKEAA